MKLARWADKLLRSRSIDMPPNLGGLGRESNCKAHFFLSGVAARKLRSSRVQERRDISAAAMASSRIEIYWNKAGTAPDGVIAQVCVSDGCGAEYLLPYPCKLTSGGWVNAASGKPLAVQVTHWKLYVETLARKRPARACKPAKSPQTDIDPDPGLK